MGDNAEVAAGGDRLLQFDSTQEAAIVVARRVSRVWAS
jgi:hypothetical protein